MASLSEARILGGVGSILVLSLGFMKPGPNKPFGHPSSFGFPGSGGSFGFADTQAKIGYAFVPNQMGSHLEDPRDLALRTAMCRSIGETHPYNMRGHEQAAFPIPAQ